MTQVTCRYCGLPFKVRRVEAGRAYYCCSGCAVASRVSVDAQGNFPITPALVGALAVGFVFFNQLLFWLLAVLLAGEGRVEVAAKCALVSWLAGAAVWLTLVVAQARAHGWRGADAVVAALALALGSAGVLVGSLGCGVLASGALLVWSLRGVLKKKTPRKPADAS